MSGKRPRIKIQPVNRSTALKSVQLWHYSRSLPAGKSIYLGAWEGDTFVGVIVFSFGANRHIARPFKMPLGSVVELTRVSLSPSHEWETSKIVSMAVKVFRKSNPKIRVLVSYADSSEGHHGGIYKAMGWVCTGRQVGEVWRVNGKRVHKRGYTGSVFGGPRMQIPVGLEIEKGVVKYRYAIGLDAGASAVVFSLKIPAPEAGLPRDHLGSGGATPTQGL